MNKRYICIFVIFFIFYNSSLLAGDFNAYDKQGEQRVKEFINSTAQKIMNILKLNTSDQQKQDALRDIFFHVMDVDWIERFVIGRHFVNMTEMQKNLYKKYYKDFLSNFYVEQFTKYNNQTLDVVNIKKLSNTQYIVTTNIVDDTKNYSVAYRIKQDGYNFKIRDIIAEKISLIITQRSEFNSIISKNGINGLIQSLKKK